MKVPQQTRTISRCVLTYNDGETAEFDIVDSQGFHRVEKMEGSKAGIIMHEVFFTYGNTRPS